MERSNLFMLSWTTKTDYIKVKYFANLMINYAQKALNFGGMIMKKKSPIVDLLNYRMIRLFSSIIDGDVIIYKSTVHFFINWLINSWNNRPSLKGNQYLFRLFLCQILLIQASSKHLIVQFQSKFNDWLAKRKNMFDQNSTLTSRICYIFCNPLVSMPVKNLPVGLLARRDYKINY